MYEDRVDGWVYQAVPPASVMLTRAPASDMTAGFLLGPTSLALFHPKPSAHRGRPARWLTCG